jgi:hypothetical protein
MITITGGVTILPNSDNKEFMDKLEKAGVKIKMPFKATGFSSSKMPRCVDMTDIILKTDKVDAVKGDVDVKPTVKPVKKGLRTLLKKKRTGRKS